MDLILAAIAVALISTAILLYIAAKRVAPAIDDPMPKRMKQFNSSKSAKMIMNDIVNLATKSHYSVDETDESTGRIIVSKGATLFSWGFFFPIQIVEKSDNSCLVTVGIKSKLIQIGPIVWWHLDRLIKQIQNSP